jgi:hypothetical protein
MCPKIRCDRKSTVFLKNILKLNKPSIALETRGHEKSRRHLPAPRSAAVAAVVPRSLSFFLFDAYAVDKKKRRLILFRCFLMSQIKSK